MLLIGTTGTETRFLSEAELPECARLAYGAEGREDARPEEIADRELAEALQRSIQESGKKHPELSAYGVFFIGLSSAQLKVYLHVPLKASYSQPHLCSHLNLKPHDHFMSSLQQIYLCLGRRSG